MAAKAFLVVCASALCVQVISANYIRDRAQTHVISAPICDAAYYDNIIASNWATASGGGLGVTTSSLYAPNGLSVLSENEILGWLDVSGNLPVLAAVAFEDTLPTSGSAGTTYSCGNEEVGITSESIDDAGINAVGYRGNYGSAFASNAAAAATGNAEWAGARHIGSGHGYAGHGYAGHGNSGHGYAGRGYAGREYAGHGYAGHGYAGLGYAGHGNAGHGNAGHGYAGHGYAGHGYAGHGSAGHGYAGHGYAGLGYAGHGNAGHGYAGRGYAGHGYAGHGYSGH